MHKALYRKYRPADFDDVYGQEHITSVLKYQCATDRVSHAYLFCGSRGTGKTSCAKILAKAVNCEHPENGNPCGKCPSCLAIDSGSTTDVVEMDAASNNGVDYIREIRDEVVYAPAMLKKRVYIIDEVHMLSTGAFNALLKTLEEPPSHVLFILATTELHELPATIISRCQRFDFRRIAVDVICDRLRYIAEREGISLEDSAARIIARQAQGGMRDAVSLFELCSGGGDTVTESAAAETLGIGGYELAYKAAVAMAEKDISTLLSIIADIEGSSGDVAVFWRELTTFHRDMMVLRNLKDPAGYLDLTETERLRLTDAAGRFNLNTLVNNCRVLDETAREMRRSPEEKRTIAEFAMIRICNPALDMSAEALSARIAELEDKLALMAGVGYVPTAAPAKKSAPDQRPPSHEETAPEAEVASADPVIAETAASAPAEEKSARDQWTEAVNLSGVAEKLSRTDKGLYSFFGGARAYVSADGKKVRVTVKEKFAAGMLSGDNAKKTLAEAFLLCGITDGMPEIEVICDKKPTSSPSPIDEIMS